MADNIVQVQYKRRYGGGYTDKQYAYVADVPVSVGDVVKCPTKFGDTEGRVARAGIPESEIPAWCGELKHITEPATPGGDLFADFF